MSRLSEYKHSNWSQELLHEMSEEVIQQRNDDCRKDLEKFEKRHNCTLEEYQQKYQKLLNEGGGSEEYKLKCARYACELQHWECLAQQLKKGEADLQKLKDEPNYSQNNQ